jgi:dinuclear metal center YbgI/SA1388 family protein
MPETPITCDELVAFLDDLLDAHEGGDYGPNGLQVQGRSQITKVVTGVSACLELFERAAAADADAVLVHHGIFWHGMPLPLTGVQHGRVASLIQAGVNLIAYHLPLDRHPDLGNNAVAAREFGLLDIEPFGDAKGLPVGFAGRFAEPVGIRDLARRTLKIFGQEPQVFGRGPERISTLGIISGGAQKELYRAIDEGLDAFLTGEVSEWVMNLAREAGIHYLAAGHYATERLGIRALGRRVADRFDIPVEFIDVPNPV